MQMYFQAKIFTPKVLAFYTGTSKLDSLSFTVLKLVIFTIQKFDCLAGKAAAARARDLEFDCCVSQQHQLNGKFG